MSKTKSKIAQYAYKTFSSMRFYRNNPKIANNRTSKVQTRKAF